MLTKGFSAVLVVGSAALLGWCLYRRGQQRPRPASGHQILYRMLRANHCSGVLRN